MIVESVAKHSYAGWGTLVFFDTEEENIWPGLVGTIPKLHPQWKISHELKPISYERETYNPIPVSLRVVRKEKTVLTIDFPFPNMRMKVALRDVAPIVCPAPSLGEWSKIEITHERNEQEGNYILALSVEDQEVGRVQVDSQVLSKLTDVKIFLGKKQGAWADSQHGCVKGLIVLDKS